MKIIIKCQVNENWKIAVKLWTSSVQRSCKGYGARLETNKKCKRCQQQVQNYQFEGKEVEHPPIGGQGVNPSRRKFAQLAYGNVPYRIDK